jgi:broad specificity phosphatase PhoE
MNERVDTQSTFYLLRHGEVEGGTRFRGITDDPLSEKGWQQMSLRCNTIPEIQHIISSPLKRCSLFAHALSGKTVNSVEIFDELQEINFGRWEGKSVQQIEVHHAPELRAFWQDPVNNTPDEGEPLIQFRQRIVRCWHRIIHQYQNQKVLIISHAGVQKIILAEVLNMPLESIHKFEIPHACLSVINVYYSLDNSINMTISAHG